MCFCEANLLSSARRSEQVQEALTGAKLVLPDGIAVLYLARLNGIAAPERIPGPNFMLAACEYGLERGWRHFFYGGAQGVPERMAETLACRYPGLKVAGTWSPPFRELTEEEEEQTKAMIESAGTDLLWIGLGSPKQELWMARRSGRIDVPIMLGVGAAFDFHSGNLPWAPPLVRKLGMEWAYRMLTGGRQTLLRNVRCVSHVALLLVAAAWRRMLTRREGTNHGEGDFQMSSKTVSFHLGTTEETRSTTRTIL
jgi:N-acetylglucosaminyldiphosphoundecaprenol N-acetyl-beta-D-mannosaminyltransferase